MYSYLTKFNFYNTCCRGDGCGRDGSPAVSARVSTVRDDWIYPTVCENSRAPPAFCRPQQAPEGNNPVGENTPQQKKDPSSVSKCGSIGLNNGRGGAAGASKDCTTSRAGEGGGLRRTRKLKGSSMKKLS